MIYVTYCHYTNLINDNKSHKIIVLPIGTLFDRINNNLWNPYPFSLATGNLLSALKLDPDIYLLGHSNGTIYKYQYSMSSVTTFLTGYTAIKLKYDEVNNKLYVVEANKVATFDFVVP